MMNMNALMEMLPTFDVKWTRNLPVVTPIQIEHKRLRDEEAGWVFEMVYYTMVLGVVLVCILAAGGFF